MEARKQQDVSFEVGGRVAFIVDTTTQLAGRWTEAGQVVVTGDMLARLDPRDHEIARDNAQAVVAVSDENLRLGITERDKVLPARIEARRSELRRAEAEYERISAAAERSAVSQIELIRSTADRDGARAELLQAEAELEGKQAEVAALRARQAQARQGLEQAEHDLARCTLYAPFSGEVAEVLVEAGGNALAGEPVAHLVMTDPMRINLALSAQAAAGLHPGQAVHFQAPGEERLRQAVVYEKATIADADTRTFRVSLLARNERGVAGIPAGDPRLAYPRITNVTRALGYDPDDPSGSLMVEETRSLRQDAGGSYVWAALDAPPGIFADGAAVLPLRRVRVVPGDQRLNFQGLYVMRSLEDPGALDADAVVALDVPDDYVEGTPALIGRDEWRLRAGQIVRVLLEASPPSPGLFVPMDALKPTGRDGAQVFVLQDGGVRAVAVRTLDPVGQLIRIEAADAAGAALLVEGAQVVTDFVHFLRDGEPVQVVGTRELRP